MTDALVEKISDFATGLTIFAGLVAWWFAREDANRKADELDRYKEESKKEVAVINKSAAEANKQAEEARLKTAEIQALVEWRTVSKDQVATLQSALSAKPSSVKFVYVSNDPEALYFAIQLSRKAFTNWNIVSESRDFSGRIVFGLRIEGTSEKDVKFVRDAFRSAEVPFTTEPIPSHSSVGFGTVIEGQPEPTVEIIVGSKPRPLP